MTKEEFTRKHRAGAANEESDARIEAAFRADLDALLAAERERLAKAVEDKHKDCFLCAACAKDIRSLP